MRYFSILAFNLLIFIQDVDLLDEHGIFLLQLDIMNDQPYDLLSSSGPGDLAVEIFSVLARH